MKYELNGISTPFGGVSWNKTNSVKDKFSFLLFYLESKRILVNPIEMEKKEWCIESVLEIKKQLVFITEDTVFKKDDLSIIRNMIKACNQYLDMVSPLDLPNIIYKSHTQEGSWNDLQFDKAMKQFRNSFKQEIEYIEKRYRLSFHKNIPNEFQENYMSTNISKQKREALLNKIKEIRAFISAAPQDENTSNLLSYLSDLEKDVNGKKYGLVFEEHREEIDEVLDTHTPVLTEDKGLFIDNGGQMNFLIEGDNLASLKLLEKTHKNKIDLIYIDPPYNTGNKDFIYDDIFVDSEDSFKHSKWVSFMSERLTIAKKLLSNEGAIFIQIDDNEQAALKMLCDDVFSADNFMGIIIQNKMNAKNDTVNIQKNHEYILAYRKKTLYINGSRVKPTLLQIKQKYRPAVKEGNRYYYVGDAITTRGEGGTLNARPNLGYTIYYNPNTDDKIAIADYDVELARTSNSIEEIYSHDESLIEKGYIPILPPKVRGKLGCWTWALEKFNNETDNIIITGKRSNLSVKKRTFVPAESIIEQNGKLFYISIEQSNSRSIVDFSTNDGTNVLTDVMGVRATFSNPKNLDLIEYLVSLKQGKNNTILDFFAGSGTTGHAVMKLNAEDGGNRKFILCTNNENNICRDVTYERIRRVIDKENYPTSLKYYKVDYIPISDRMYYEYADELLLHIRELVELENGINFTDNAEIGIVLTDEELNEFIENISCYKKCKKLYVGHDVLFDAKQAQTLKNKRISVNIIPDYYYKKLEG